MSIYKVKDSLDIDSIPMLASEKWSWQTVSLPSYYRENLCRTRTIMSTNHL